jgi:hypothetical protein
MSATPIDPLPADVVFDGADFAFATAGGLVLVLHGKATPTDDAWQRYLDAAQNIVRAGRPMPTLVFTDGGAPNGDQRKPLFALFKGIRAPVAVVSLEPVVARRHGPLRGRG